MLLATAWSPDALLTPLGFWHIFSSSCEEDTCGEKNDDDEDDEDDEDEEELRKFCRCGNEAFKNVGARALDRGPEFEETGCWWALKSDEAEFL